MFKVIRLMMVLCLLVPSASWGLDFSIKKPQIFQVKNVAVISLYSNASIRKMDNRAGGMVSAAGFLAKKAQEKGDPASAHFGGTELIDYALDTYAKALGEVQGWTVADPKAVLASPAYQSFIEDYKKTVGPKGMEMMDKSRTAPAGMAPYLMIDKKKIKELCAALNVDAVAVIDVDLAQESTFVTVGAVGKVWPPVAGSLQVINKDGQHAVNELPAASMVRRSKPKEAVSMKLDTISDNEESRAAYKEAIKAEAEYMRDHLNKALAEKK